MKTLISLLALSTVVLAGQALTIPTCFGKISLAPTTDTTYAFQGPSPIGHIDTLIFITSTTAQCSIWVVGDGICPLTTKADSTNSIIKNYPDDTMQYYPSGPYVITRHYLISFPMVSGIDTLYILGAATLYPTADANKIWFQWSPVSTRTACPVVPRQIQNRSISNFQFDILGRIMKTAPLKPYSTQFIITNSHTLKLR